MARYIDDRPEMSPISIALVGGAIGALTALFFSDERRRRKVRELFSDFKENIQEKGDEIRQEAEESVDEVKQKVMGATPKARDVKQAMKEIR
jgi:gas vesicle protein